MTIFLIIVAALFYLSIGLGIVLGCYEEPGAMTLISGLLLWPLILAAAIPMGILKSMGDRK